MNPANMAPQEILTEFKRSGKFDAVRRLVLEEFSSSPECRELISKLNESCGGINAPTQGSLVAKLGNSEILKEFNLISRKYLDSSHLRNRIKDDLKRMFEGEEKKEEPIAVPNIYKKQKIEQDYKIGQVIAAFVPDFSKASKESCYLVRIADYNENSKKQVAIKYIEDGVSSMVTFDQMFLPSEI
ncbi:hypothetical protein HK103_000899 [Boothiomyces macroporosus]|uniref:BOD1/SHG1 domain-containing protein n=1 Tax=Boothiomyces macroporosus TaxID=261099 RepID=A0AAD5UK65_9FUNG|nr:hypothetical protein HK103_000899 [Boothiomyces macroporosus]